MSRNAAWSFMISAVTSSNVLRRRICMARRLEAASQYSVIASNWEGRCLARDVHHWAYSAAPFSVATPVRVHAQRTASIPSITPSIPLGFHGSSRS